MSDSQAAKDEWPSAEEKAKNIAQAKALRVQAEKGGLRFSAYLPPGLADWLLGLIEKGTFHDPSEAVFVILGEHQDLEPTPTFGAKYLLVHFRRQSTTRARAYRPRKFSKS